MVSLIRVIRSFVDIFRLHHSQQLYFDYSNPSFDSSVGYSDDSFMPPFDFANDEDSDWVMDDVVVEEEDEDLHNIEDENYDLVPHSSFESWSLLE
jgi:hypothetical protein